MKVKVVLIVIALVAASGFAPSLRAQLDASVAGTALDSLASAGAKADTLEWKYKGVIGAGFNAVQLSNWAGGGQNAISIRGLFLGVLDYAHDRWSWENNLDLGYSLTKLGDQEFRKSDDRIIYTSKGSWKQTDWFRWTAFLDFRTQFYLGYNYDQPDSTSPTGFLKISNLMAPGYLTGSLGGEWTPVPEFKVMVAPVANRSIFVLDQALADLGAFGVDPGSNVQSDFGGVINMSLLWEFVENVTWKSRFNGFVRYATPDLWVLTLENAFLMKVNSFLTVGFLTDVFYDDKVPVVRNDGTVGPATQLRNQLTIDLTYSLSNF